MMLKKRIDQLKKTINQKRENIPSDISDKAIALALYYIEKEIMKRGGSIAKDFADKFYEVGKRIYKKKLVDIEDESIADEDIAHIP